MTRAEAHLDINAPLRHKPLTQRDLRALRWKYRLYDLRYPERWYARLWAALVVVWWVFRGMVMRDG